MSTLAARLTEQLGGPARRRAVTVLAAVLGLDAADKGAIGAVAPQLERSLHIGATQLGLLVTVSSIVGALATLPIGVLTDRVVRVRLLELSIVGWALAEAASAAAPTYLVLLGVRVALGGMSATSGPTVASLTGDLFPASDRSRMYGFILTGEVLGTGAGVLLAGLLSGWLGWRAGFAALAAPSLAIALWLHRSLPEPARGGQSRIGVGDQELTPAGAAAVGEPGTTGTTEQPARRRRDAVVRMVLARRDVTPREGTVIDPSATRWPLHRVVRYVLRVRTNLLLIIASALGYFFISGLRTFAVIYVKGRYHLSQGITTVLVVLIGAGVIVGLIAAGRYTDHLISKGHIDGRVTVGAGGFLLAVAALLLGLLAGPLWVAVPAFFVAGAALAAPNPGLDAARLDVLPSFMWGRGEGVRTFLRDVLEGFAPLVFGVLTALFGGRNSGFDSASSTLQAHAAAAAEAHGIEMASLVLTAPIVLAAVLLSWARHYYPSDIAAAARSDVKRGEAGRPDRAEAV